MSYSYSKSMKLPTRSGFIDWNIFITRGFKDYSDEIIDTSDLSHSITENS